MLWHREPRNHSRTTKDLQVPGYINLFYEDFPFFAVGLKSFFSVSGNISNTKRRPLKVIYCFGHLPKGCLKYQNIKNATRNNIHLKVRRCKMVRRHGWLVFYLFFMVKTEFFFKRLRGVSMSDDTHIGVFDMASQMINNSWRNSRLKLAKFYGN